MGPTAGGAAPDLGLAVEVARGFAGAGSDSRRWCGDALPARRCRPTEDAAAGGGGVDLVGRAPQAVMPSLVWLGTGCQVVPSKCRRVPPSPPAQTSRGRCQKSAYSDAVLPVFMAWKRLKAVKVGDGATVLARDEYIGGCAAPLA